MPAPPNDLCGDAIEVFNGVTPFDNLGATDDGPPWLCAGGGADVWFIYEATCTGDVVFSLCNDGAQPPTDYDSAMEVFDSGSCMDLAGSFRQCNDDGCGFTGGPSLITYPVVVRNQYIIRLGGFMELEGSGHLEITPQENCVVDIVRSIPTLSDWGLIAMGGVLGLAAVYVIRRRKLAA